jgi:nucleotide-binding universal stress UspA family protein
LPPSLFAAPAPDQVRNALLSFSVSLNVALGRAEGSMSSYHAVAETEERRPKMYKNILIATDGSDLARRAVEHGLALAKALNARATAVTVTEPWVEVLSGGAALAFPVEEYEREMTAKAAQAISSVSDLATSIGITCDTIHVRDQHPAEGIIAVAKERGCDLIVMASHGRRGLQRLLLGSQTNLVVTQSTIPVLICR